MRAVSVYGSTGLIGGFYCNLYPNEIIKVERNERSPHSKDILYLISTVDNYNVFDNPLLDINTNLNVLIETLESCRKKYNSDFTFNFISSWFVYGKTEQPAKESSACNPKGFYSITKRAAEQMLISYCKTYKINYRILRLCNTYGTGDTKASVRKNALQHLASEVMKNRDIKLYNNGKDMRDFMHVEDVCRAINLVISKGSFDEIYNIGGGVSYNFIETMTYIKEKSQSISKFEFVDPPDFHLVVQTKDMSLDVSKLKGLGFRQGISIWQGLDKMLENRN